MKSIALVVSFALHFGALSVLPSADGSTSKEDVEAAQATQAAQAFAEACKCDLEMSADCAEILESR